jgi:hypothetical protein
MKKHGDGELNQFIIDMTQELIKKDALIFDLRYNTGGNVHDEVYEVPGPAFLFAMEIPGWKINAAIQFFPQ